MRRVELIHSDADVALAILSALDKAEVQYAVLSDVEALEAGSIPGSDVDIAVDRNPALVASVVLEAGIRIGISPVLADWSKELRSLSTWYATRSGAHGANLDLLYDPEGKGLYGIKTSALLARAKTDKFPVRLDPEGEIVYLWQKRSQKGDVEGLQKVRQAAKSLDQERLEKAFLAIAGAPPTNFDDLIASQPERRLPLINRVANWTSTKARRLINPSGFWIHANLHNRAVATATILKRWHPNLSTIEAPNHRFSHLIWYLTAVLSQTARSTIVISYGRTPRWPKPWLQLVDDHAEDASAIEVIEGMAARCTNRLRSSL